MELLPVEEEKAVLRGQYRRLRPVGRKTPDEGVHRLAGVRHKGRDIDEGDHVGMRTRLGDHRPTVGVADENDRFALRVVVVVVLQLVVDTAPAGAVYETAVNENDRPLCRASFHDDLLSALPGAR